MAERDLTEAEKQDSTSVCLVTDEEKKLAHLCHVEFENGNYESCTKHLDKLLVTRSSDPKVIHNKAVVDFYISGQRKLEEFRRSLTQICVQVNTTLENVESLDDVEHCIYYYNYAVVLYHLHQYRSAIAVLDKVFHFIEPLEERLGQMVCFLLVELYLCTYQPDKALGMIAFIENTMLGNQGSSASSNGKSAMLEKETPAKEGDPADTLVAELLKPKLQHYKARCYLMLRSVKGCKREIKGLINSSNVSPAMTHFKANLEYLRGNFRKAIKVLNSSPSLSTRSPENNPTLFYNDLGCIHFYMQKPNLGCFYFQKALQENDLTIKAACVESVGADYRHELLYNLGIQLLYAKRPLKAFDCLIEAIQVYHTNPRLWLRLAECCIQVQQPDNEADFRVKERKKDIVQGFVGSGPHRKMILTPHISNKYKSSVNGGSSAIPKPTMEFASLCLKNALVLLLEDGSAPNSGAPTSGTSDEGDLGAQGPTESSAFVPAPPGNPILRTEIGSLRCAILVASAYVSLSLGDYLMALNHAETLLSQNKLSGVYRFLGHLYAAEALVNIDHLSDAIQHLSPSNLKDLSSTTPSTDKDDREKGAAEDDNTSHESACIHGWYPNSLAAAKAIMHYNLAVVYALRGDFDKAGEILRQFNTIKGSGTDVPIQAVMLAMYIQSQLGHADLLKSIVKQHCPQYR